MKPFVICFELLLQVLGKPLRFHLSKPPPVVNSSILNATATFNGNGKPKTRQTYYIKSAAEFDLANATNASIATVAP